MRRRHVLGLIGSLAASAALPALAQSPRSARVAWVTAQRRASLEPYLAEVRAGLADLGWVEGRNLTIDYRFGDDDLSKVPGLVADAIAGKAEIVVAQGSAVSVLSRLSLPVPLVYVTSGDPVLSGFAESLAKPKGNMTGLTFMAAEMNGKRIELLREINPALRKLALVANPEHPGATIEFAFAHEKAKALGLDVAVYETRTMDQLEAAFATMVRNPAEAISVFSDGFAVQNRDKIIGFGMKQGIPVVSGWAVFAQSGAICTYGPRLSSSYRRLAFYVSRILGGAVPADLPIEQPVTFELVVNMKSARQLGLALPTAVVARADDVID